MTTEQVTAEPAISVDFLSKQLSADANPRHVGIRLAQLEILLQAHHLLSVRDMGELGVLRFQLEGKGEAYVGKDREAFVAGYNLIINGLYNQLKIKN